MTRCRDCGQSRPDDSRFCPHCGARLADSVEGPTRSVQGGPPPGPSPVLSPRPPSGSTPQDRFLPGTMIAGRYRIFGLVGRGGMGEVYRADDLKLGQAVALKFLPAEVEQDAGRLSRFLDEVRIARQISHTNVCRVYDVGEVDGHHFLSMEFVDGEDLASLLRRIGRLPRDKSIQIARQVCAGLAAAHELGILHRDLKPGNIMIDGRGRARITDFGLARLAGDILGAEVGAGTPAYMAPEQIAGEGVTVRSDLYSLGLVLYELCTGQPAFKGVTPADRARLKSETTPTSPGRIVEGFDPAVERVILRCLERDPAKRPASALMVAAALPGGDPLAAALAAGETPSPELVAEAGAVGGLAPIAAWACAAALALGVLAVMMIAPETQITRLVPLDKAPEVLADRARDVIQRLGYRDPAADSAFGFELDDDYLGEVERGEPSPRKWRRLAAGPPFAIGFWYRQSPRPLLPSASVVMGPSFQDPPPLVAGMVGVRLDPEGRLLELGVTPPDREPAAEGTATFAPAAEPDGQILLELAGLDPGTLRSVEPAWFPSVFADQQVAWEAVPASTTATPTRVEAAFLRGRPVAFRRIEPWTRPRGPEVRSPNAAQSMGEAVLVTMLLASLTGGALLARHNIRLGRGDRRGAFRLAVTVVVAEALYWLLTARHVAGFAEIDRFLSRTGQSLLIGGLVWTLYLALEPYFRRFWPQIIVSWVRLLDGRFRDPLVGRDALVGLVAGTVFTLTTRLMVIGPGWLGLPSVRPAGEGSAFELLGLAGLSGAAGLLGRGISLSLFFPMAIGVVLLLARIILRRTWAAWATIIVLNGLVLMGTTGNPYVDIGFGCLNAILHITLVFRFGLLADVVGGFTEFVLSSYPMTFDAGHWYSGNTLLALLVLAAIAVLSFRASLAGRPALGGVLAPETRRA